MVILGVIDPPVALDNLILFTIVVVGKIGGTAPESGVGTVYTAAAELVPVLEKLLNKSAKEKSPSCCFFF